MFISDIFKSLIPLFYIHDAICVSPQQTIGVIDLDSIAVFYNNKFIANEPTNINIPLAILRRMNKGIRMGVSAAMPLIESSISINGVIIGSSNLGMTDAISFLDQIIDYNEGILSPGSFVNGSSNTLAAQIALLSKNNGYNITHVHRGLAFENAIIDVSLQLSQHTDGTYILGAADEYSEQNYNIEYKAGWYKKELINSNELFNSKTEGTLIGEIAAMFKVSNEQQDAICKVIGTATFHTEDTRTVQQKLKEFISKNLIEEKNIDLLISGENGDTRFLPFYAAVESFIVEKKSVARYKHLMGECGISSAGSLWLAYYILKYQKIPSSLLKIKGEEKSISNILIYNNFRGSQHSLILISIND